MGSAFCAALALSGITLAVFGVDEKGIYKALFLTGRLAFVFFWLAYAGSALASLFGPWFAPLKRNGREAGLAFASVLAVHLGLIATLCAIGAAPGTSTFVFFGTAAGFTFLIALFSIGRLQRMLPAWLWWILRVVGMNYIAYAFAVDFLNEPFHGGLKRVALYAPFAILAVAGPCLRVAAFVQRIGPLVLRGSSFRAG